MWINQVIVCKDNNLHPLDMTTMNLNDHYNPRRATCKELLLLKNHYGNAVKLSRGNKTTPEDGKSNPLPSKYSVELLGANYTNRWMRIWVLKQPGNRSTLSDTVYVSHPRALWVMVKNYLDTRGYQSTCEIKEERKTFCLITIWNTLARQLFTLWHRPSCQCRILTRVMTWNYLVNQYGSLEWHKTKFMYCYPERLEVTLYPIRSFRTTLHYPLLL